jgi:hypothetical protein
MTGISTIESEWAASGKNPALNRRENIRTHEQTPVLPCRPRRYIVALKIVCETETIWPSLSLNSELEKPDIPRQPM